MREKNTEDREKWGRRKDAIYILAAITLGTLASGVMLAAAFPDSDLVRAVKDHFIIQDGDPTPPSTTKMTVELDHRDGTTAITIPN